MIHILQSYSFEKFKTTSKLKIFPSDIYLFPHNKFSLISRLILKISKIFLHTFVTVIHINNFSLSPYNRSC